MFKCSAECCEHSTDSMSQVHHCIDRCHTPLAQAQGVVTSELEKFQVSISKTTSNACDHNSDYIKSPVAVSLPTVYAKAITPYLQDRLSRCTMHCNDKAKDLVDSGDKEPAVRALMESCVGTCVDDHVNLIPSMTRRLKDNLDSIPQ